MHTYIERFGTELGDWIPSHLTMLRVLGGVGDFWLPG